MNDDITINPAQTNRGFNQQLKQELYKIPTGGDQMEQQAKMHAASGIQCPHCGAMNEEGAMFCASCGSALGKTSCPNCGAELDADADFCETCRRYVKKDVCSFCGAHLNAADAFCPECGSPRGGIVCPTCHTLNEFAFCRQCGTPLTEDARQLVAQVSKMPEYKEMQKLASELQELDMILPYSSERERTQEQLNAQLRERVLKLLAEDRGVSALSIPKSVRKRMSKEEYAAKKKERLGEIASILEKLAQTPQAKPAMVRNYAMACRPQGVRLAWECNYKHALHSSPCGCAKPQMGGKWVILGKDTKKEIKDDK